MKFRLQPLALGLALLAGPAYAQLPAVISAPIAEGQSRKQVLHQTVTTAQMGTAKSLAGKMKVVSGQIKGVIDKTQQLHDTWYSSLLQISSGVRNYRRVREIYDVQSAMIQQYSQALPTLKKQGFTAEQATNASKVYTAMLLENMELIGELSQIMSAGKAKMTDPERLEFINNIADRMQQQQTVMDYYTSRCRAIAQRQMQAVRDEQSVLALMGAK